ncbi:hypothetical protein Aaci_2315 [Alicyclobacillus acidocaldarius subsp. acidocaldarius DSM 446]|uniref:Uncharacterized protein n=1 Tax=Alicyclobacillus acidocaldarius subsp. acidocaldarius (strain ATCC 27009 / DSM 446 / BCRC 14685 / JCM 5260 / KCTC 1825 / NBRC 15652 / NCIMB 11725 / NRRL B-14509 / 104-IA) TaxID=521098 RepID=C8WRR1_ALIAD|nr:hypothetical protein Aaci_2315 [Alicyclobacillus acidocaldarius subsp. acidocaldarius DSM 446]
MKRIKQLAISLAAFVGLLTVAPVAANASVVHSGTITSSAIAQDPWPGS